MDISILGRLALGRWQSQPGPRSQRDRCDPPRRPEDGRTGVPAHADLRMRRLAWWKRRPGDGQRLRYGPRVSLRSDPEAAALLPDLSPADEAAVARTLRTWLLRGDCRLMADGFLRQQTPGTEGGRARRCEAFDAAFTVPALSAADIIVRDVTTRPGGASAVVTDDFSGVEASATLVRTPTGWRIRAWTT